MPVFRVYDFVFYLFLVLESIVISNAFTSTYKEKPWRKNWLIFITPYFIFSSCSTLYAQLNVFMNILNGTIITTRHDEETVTDIYIVIFCLGHNFTGRVDVRFSHKWRGWSISRSRSRPWPRSPGDETKMGQSTQQLRPETGHHSKGKTSLKNNGCEAEV